MLMRIRVFKEQGLSAMVGFLSSFYDRPDRIVKFEQDLLPLLTDASLTSTTPNAVQVDPDRTFARRYDMAEYLHGLVPRLGLADPIRVPGLWAWLSLLWFDQLAPITKGVRKIGENAKWLPESGWKYYRHLVLGAYWIYAANSDHPERAMALLHNPPHTPGELVGQLAATQDVAQSKAAIGAATSLYFDMEKGRPKKGAGGSGPGSPRRLRAVIDQFDRTFDLQSLTEQQLLALLPAEFNRFNSLRSGSR